MTAPEATNGYADIWPAESDNGRSWWAGGPDGVVVAPAPAAPPPPPPPPPPAPAVAAPVGVTMTAPAPSVWPEDPPEAPPVAAPSAAPVVAPAGGVAVQPAPTSTAVEPAPAAVPARPSWGASVRARYADKRPRYRVAVPLAVALVLLLLAWGAMKTFGHAVASGIGTTIEQHDATLVSTMQALANPPDQNVTVTNVLSWLPCPLTSDAAGMIGYATGGASLNPERATAVATQAQKWLLKARPDEMRITQPDPTHLVVFVGDVTLGVPLLDCTVQNLPTASPTTTAAR